MIHNSSNDHNDSFKPVITGKGSNFLPKSNITPNPNNISGNSGSSGNSSSSGKTGYKK